MRASLDHPYCLRMQPAPLTIVFADPKDGGGRYDFTKLPPAALKAHYAKKKRNVRERARFLVLRQHWVVGFLLVDFRVLVSGTRVVFLTDGYVEPSAANQDVWGRLLFLATDWAWGFDDLAYVKIEAECLRMMQKP